MYIYVIGFAAQLFFSARIIVQWVLSEKAKRVVSPSLFWIFSIAGSYLLFIYGWMRDDFAIILGQVISYYVYIWNLRAKGDWAKIRLITRYVLTFTPLIAVAMVLRDVPAFGEQFFHNHKIPIWLLVYGSLGQIVFTLRFVYQWIYSYRRHRSVLPVGFWRISLAGSLIIVSYAVYRHDPVLIIGQSVGLVAYLRNIMIGKKERSGELVIEQTK